MIRIAFFVFCFLIIQASAVQATDISQLVQQLQQNPGDTALHEQIVKLAKEENLAIPEEARRHFVKGSSIAESAKDAAGQKLAVESFREAIKIAPWWGDAYYNMSVAQDLADDYAGARQSLQSYILTGPGEKEVRAAQDKIYVLEGKQDLAKSESAARAEQAAREKAEQEAEARAAEQSVWTGTWKRDRYDDGAYVMTTAAQSQTTGSTVEFIDEYGSPFLKGTTSGTEVTSWEVKGPCGWLSLYPQVSTDRRTIQYQQDLIDVTTCTPIGLSQGYTLTRQ